MKLHQKRTAEPQNIECRMSKDGFASGFAFGYEPTGRSIFFLKNRPFDTEAHDGQNTLLRHSIFIIRYSTFAFLQCLLRFDWPFFKPVVWLNPSRLRRSLRRVTL